jgi:hypothetical protein
VEFRFWQDVSFNIPTRLNASDDCHHRRQIVLTVLLEQIRLAASYKLSDREDAEIV